jgi:chorismate mutase / prephenate dehydratase
MKLQNIRQQINKLDYEIHDLLNERAKLALQVGKIKVGKDGPNVEFHRPEREREVLEEISKYNVGPLTDEAVAHIFKAIMAECLRLQITTFSSGEKND